MRATGATNAHRVLLCIALALAGCAEAAARKSGKPPDASEDAGDNQDAGLDRDSDNSNDSGEDRDTSGDLDAGSEGDGGLAASEPDAGPREAYCAGKGPPVVVGDDADGQIVKTCTGTIARQAFSNAVCSCEDLRIQGYLATNSFASTTGAPNTAVAAGAPVGINETFSSSQYFNVGGSFTVAGSDPLGFSGASFVGGDLVLASPITAANGYVDVKRDAKFAEDLSLYGWGTIGRKLQQSTGKKLLVNTVAIPFVDRSSLITVARPCDCEPANILDVDGVVADARTDNHNATVNLDPNILSDVALNFKRTLELPCGRFYLKDVNVFGSVVLKLTGRTALFVDGDMNLVGAFVVEMGPDAELDVFVNGGLLGIGFARFSDENRPRASRVYVGGSDDIKFTGANIFVGNLYAPNANVTYGLPGDVQTGGYLKVYGSLFAKSFQLNGALDVTYDRDVINLVDECQPPPPSPPPSPPDDAGTAEPPPPPECSGTCDATCGQQSCSGGECRPCVNDADCCGALVCSPGGVCGSLILL